MDSEGVEALENIQLSVVVPVYNEVESVESLIMKLSSALSPEFTSFEIICVDDGSTDGTAEKLKQLCSLESKLVYIRFRRNFGQHAAMYAGMARARGELVATIDADLQNNPVDIIKLTSQMDNETDIVCAYRPSRKDPLSRKIPSRFLNYIAYIVTGVKLKDIGCSLRLYRKKVIDELVKYQELYATPHALINWLGFRMKEVEVSHTTRAYGKSKMNFISLMKMGYDILTGFSLIPIHIINLAGKGLTLFGIILTLMFGIFNLFSDEFLFDFTIFVSLMMFYSGLIIWAISVVGEYAARAYIESKKRPLYIIEEEKEQ
jgi:undecaprenyl-phosphate 4-deoxy-4-formamido-L-arabinose transferase